MATKITQEQIEALVDSAYDRLAASEESLSLPEGTLQYLRAEPDYVMVIKIIATVEPVVNELIGYGLRWPHGGIGGRRNNETFAELSSLLTDHRINLNGRPSKLDIARSLDVISAEDREFIESISKIRNRYAHNIRNVTRDVKDLCEEFRTNDARFYEKLLRVDMSSMNIPNDALKFFIILSFSIFLKTLEKANEALLSDVGGLLGFMEKRETE